MDNTTTHCIASGHTEPVKAAYKTPAPLCPTHYRRWKRTGSWDTARPYSKRGGPCSVTNCPNSNDNGRRGMCDAHYQQSLKGEVGELRAAPKTGCDFDGCPYPHKARGYCDTHVRQLRAGKTLTPIREYVRKDEDGCVGPTDDPKKSCGRDTVAKNLCPTHYEQTRQGKELTPVLRYVSKEGTCSVENCTRKRTSEGYCQTHYRNKLAGMPDWDKPIKDKAPDGAGHTDANGYRHRTVNGRRVSEHVLFAETVLGRKLRTDLGENVHHKNGNRSDNRTDGPFKMDDRGRLLSGNLEIWSSAQPAGQEIGPKLEWALDMLAEYGPAVNDAVKARARAVLEGMVKG